MGLVVNRVVGRGLVIIAAILVLVGHALAVHFRNLNCAQLNGIFRDRNFSRHWRRVLRPHSLTPDV